jgi:hypothetical protein
MELPPAMAMGLRNTQHVSLLAIITRSTIIELYYTQHASLLAIITRSTIIELYYTQHASLYEIALQNPVILYIVDLYDNP